jgi:vancomycin permeability regulator SanA
MSLEWRRIALLAGLASCLALLAACQAEARKGAGREAALKDVAAALPGPTGKNEAVEDPPKPPEAKKEKGKTAAAPADKVASGNKPETQTGKVAKAPPEPERSLPPGPGESVVVNPVAPLPPIDAGPACFPCAIDEVPKADVVVALGVRPAGTFTPSPGMMSNLLTAVAILNAGKADRLLVCGGYTRGHIAEAEMMAIIAQSLGVSLTRILVDNGSVDTEENAHDAAILAREKGLRSAILVAQSAHVERATKLFHQAGAFAVMHSVVGLNLAPDFPMAGVAGDAPEGKFDAIVVHGVSPGYDFDSDPLAVAPQLPALLAAASALYHQRKAPLILWHPICPRGHIPRTEVMAILLAAMGVPEKSMVLGSARRYETSGLDIAKLCAAVQARRVLALLPPDELFASVRSEGRVNPRDLGGPGTAKEAEEMYRKAGIEAVPVFVEK